MSTLDYPSPEEPDPFAIAAALALIIAAFILLALPGCVSVGFVELDGCVRACERVNSDPLAVVVNPVTREVKCACQDASEQPL